MEKSNKELAVELAVSAIQATAQLKQNSPHQPLSGNDIRSILQDCYSAVCELDNGK